MKINLRPKVAPAPPAPPAPSERPKGFGSGFSGDVDFLWFYEGEWKRMLDECKVPGMVDPCSWDRRAAWLLWQALKR